MIQRSEEWYYDRLGMVTASRMKDVCSAGDGKTRMAYMYQLVAEIKTGKLQDQFESKAMRDGVENEPLAKMEYEARTGNWITECGSIKHPTIRRLSASPDGLISYDGIIEIKCPSPRVFVEFEKTRKIKREYELQMTTQLMCTQRDWADFVVYCPDIIDPERRMIITRFELENGTIDLITREVKRFVLELEDILNG